MITQEEADAVRAAYKAYLHAPVDLAKALQVIYQEGQDRDEPVTQDDIALFLPISRQATARWLHLDVDELLRRLAERDEG